MEDTCRDVLTHSTVVYWLHMIFMFARDRDNTEGWDAGGTKTISVKDGAVR